MLKNHRYLIYSVAVFAALILAALPVSAQWQNLTVDSLTNDGIEKTSGVQSLDLDFLGYSHAAWIKHDDGETKVIQYATNSPDGEWGEIQDVTNQLMNPQHPAIAVSPVDDKPYIAFISDSRLYLAYTNLVGWVIDSVSAYYNANYSPSIAIDQSGNIHIAWVAFDDSRQVYKIIYAIGQVENWQQQVLAGSELGEYGSGASPYIDLGSDGRAHIMYRGGGYENYHIHHAWNDAPGGLNWQYEILYSPNINDQSKSLAIDSENGLHTVFSGNDGWGLPMRSYYMYKPSGGDWHSPEMISSDQSLTSPIVALDIFDKPHVALMEISGNILTGKIYYSYLDDSDIWHCDLLLEGDHFEPCLKIDHFGRGNMICYTGGNTGNYDMLFISGDVATDIENRDNIGEPISAYKLWQNYPNPFNDETMISYSIPHAGHVQLCVYNILGEKVVTLIDEYREAGDHEHKWDSSKIATGVYFYYLEFEESSLKGKAILLK